MLESVLNHSNSDRATLLLNRQQPHIPDHVKCGEVYTWLCAGEFYGVECKLCEDHPVCPLSEFPEHMDIWHTDWEATTSTNVGDNMHFTDDEQQDNNDLDNNEDNIKSNNDQVLSFTNENSGLFEPEDQPQNKRTTSQEERDELLEPFEQVLIEQDITPDTTQIDENVNDEEYLKDINEQVAQAEQCQSENKPKQKSSFNVNKTFKHTLIGHRVASVTESEDEMQNFTEIEESPVEVNVKQTKDLRNKQQLQLKSKCNEKSLRKCRNLTNINEITKTSESENLSSRENIRKSLEIARNLEKELFKVKQIKRILTKIVKEINDLEENSETDIETCENETNYTEYQKEYQNDLKTMAIKTKCSENLKMEFKTDKNENGKENETSEAKDMNRDIEINNKTNTKNKQRNQLIKNYTNFKKQPKLTMEISDMKTTENKIETSDGEIKHKEVSLNETNESNLNMNKIKQCESDLKKIENKEELNEKVKQLRKTKLNRAESEEKFNKFETKLSKIETEIGTILKTDDALNKNEDVTTSYGEESFENENNKIIHESLPQALGKYSKIDHFLNRRTSKRNLKKNVEEPLLNKNMVKPCGQEKLVTEEEIKTVLYDPSKQTNKTFQNRKEQCKHEQTTSETLLNDKKHETCINIKQRGVNETNDSKFLECLQKSLKVRARLNECLNRNSKSKRSLKAGTRRNETKPTGNNKIDDKKLQNKCKAIENANERKINTQKRNLNCKKKTLDLKTRSNNSSTRRKTTARNFYENKNRKFSNIREFTLNLSQANRKSPRIQYKHFLDSKHIKDENQSKVIKENEAVANRKREFKSNFKDAKKEKYRERIENETCASKYLEKFQALQFKYKMKRKLHVTKGMKWKRFRESFRNKQRNEFVKWKLKNFKCETENLIQSLSRNNNPLVESLKACEIKNHLKTKSNALENNSNNAKRTKHKPSVAEPSPHSSREFLAASLSAGKRNSAFKQTEERRVEYVTELPSTGCKEAVNEHGKDCSSNLCIKQQNTNQKEHFVRNTKQTLVTKFFENKDDKKEETLKTSQNSEIPNSLSSTNTYFSQTSSTILLTPEPLSPPSPKTEEEHFEFYEPKEKLNRQHISHLIKLYQEHPRLWDQSHPEFCEPQVCRKSWQQIAEQWNEFCKRKFTIAEVRIRISTLCQRFVQEKDRLALEGELDEYAKFPYYEQMQFLEQQKSLQKRREFYEQQNEKILEIYQHFPVLWHVSYYKLRKAKERAQAFESISQALKLVGLHLSSMAVQKRIRSLRKCYRLEKIRYLHAQVEQTTYDFEFRHYKRMQFLDKHIDPYVCHVCGKIFENLHGFREHLEIENHGSILPEENDTEIELDKRAQKDIFLNKPAKDNVVATNQQELHANEASTIVFSPISDRMEDFSESENSRDILQRFTPFSFNPNAIAESVANTTSITQKSLKFPLNAPNEPILNSLHLEDQLIEELMENVANNDSLNQQGLDQFINSVTSCEELTSNKSSTEKSLSPNIFHTENSFIVEHPDIVTNILSPCPNAESLYPENSFIVEHSGIEAEQNLCMQSPDPNLTSIAAKNVDDGLVNDNDQTLENVLDSQANVKEIVPQYDDVKRLNLHNPLTVKVQCADFSIDLKLNRENSETTNSNLNDSDSDIFSSAADISIIPLPDNLIHKMIEVYRKFPQLWNPNHLDFNSRTLRRQAWCSLTAEFNAAVGQQISWRTLHRKLTDYAKYYKKLYTEQEDYERLENKWTFYEDFKFMDDVIAVNNELQRSVHHRDNNFKIIAIYRTLPQLWDIKHPDYNKRSTKQRNIEIMCNKLQEENNLQLTTERLKNRLIELRTQYRTAKKQHLKCLKNNKKFSPDEFEFYEALSFLNDHIDPFVCDKCKMEFKKLTDYNQHLRKEHSQNSGRKKRSLGLLPNETGMENICHICGLKSTTRSNLVHHIKRHEGIRNYACTMCPKKFYASYALKVHIRSHTKECPYTCEKCGMSFVSASKLNQHVKRHFNRKDFLCDFCPKTFFTAFEKDRHERRHLNIRDKACPICGKTFVAGSSYYAHLMLHNDTKRFECDKCDMKFAQYAGLYKHKKRHHT